MKQQFKARLVDNSWSHTIPGQLEGEGKKQKQLPDEKYFKQLFHILPEDGSNTAAGVVQRLDLPEAIAKQMESGKVYKITIEEE